MGRLFDFTPDGYTVDTHYENWVCPDCAWYPEEPGDVAGDPDFDCPILIVFHRLYAIAHDQDNPEKTRELADDTMGLFWPCDPKPRCSMFVQRREPAQLLALSKSADRKD